MSSPATSLPRIRLAREFASTEARADPRPVYARLRALGPVLRSRDMFGEGFVLTRHADIAAVIRDPRFGSDRASVPGGRSMDQWWMPSLLRLLTASMVLKDPPEHRRLRRLVQQAFTPSRVERLHGRIEEITEELLDAAERRAVVDLMADLALPLPLTVIAEMLGVPVDERRRFRTLLVALSGDGRAGPWRLVGSVRPMIELTRLLRGLVELRRTEPGDDLISALVQAEEEGGDRLSEDELISMIFLLLFAGHETTVNLIGNGVLELVRHPNQLTRLREQPELIDTAVEEMLRYTNPVGMVAPRFATEDAEIAGVDIPAGSMVTLLIGSANLDPDAFGDADRFDVGRTPNRHLAFGLGAHFCLGAPLARLEARIAVPALLRRFDRMSLAVPEDALTWRPHFALRGVESLPLIATPAAARV